MRPDRYVVEQMMTCGELREILGYAQAHVDDCPVSVSDAASLLHRIETRLSGLDARDGDQVFVFVADAP